MIEVKSICGAADLTAAILGRNSSEIRLRLGLPTKRQYYSCLNCKKLTTRKRFCSTKCQWEYSHPQVKCDECHKIFRRAAIDLYRKSMKHSHYFCSQRCRGKWLGENHGFKTHPENRIGFGCGRPRGISKYDVLIPAIEYLLGHGLTLYKISVCWGLGCNIFYQVYEGKRKVKLGE